MTSIAWCRKYRKRIGDMQAGECRQSCGDCGDLEMLSRGEIRKRELAIIVEKEKSKQWVDMKGRVGS